MTPLVALAALIIALVLFTRSWRALPQLTTLLVVVAFGVIVTGGWFVHPAAALTVAWLASLVFSHHGRRNLPVIGTAVGLMFALVLLGAHWLVHPVAALGVALLASVVFTRDRRHLPVILVTVAVLGALAALGASWVLFPLAALALAVLPVLMFAGAPGRTRPRELPKPDRSEPDRQEAPLPAALPAVTADGMLAWPPIDASLATEQVQFVEVKREQGTRRRPDAPARPAEPEPATGAVQLLLQAHPDRLHGEIALRLRELQARGEEAVAHLSAHRPGENEQARLARRVVDEYAPDAVRAYLRLPARTADSVPLEGGRTGRDLLLEQLDLLLGELCDLLEDETHALGQDLLAHRRFLRSKFRSRGSDFEP